jgi:hypothetical protein
MVGLADNDDLHDSVLFKDEEPPTWRDGQALDWNANDATFPFLGPLCHLLPLPVLVRLCLSQTTAVVPVDPQQGDIGVANWAWELHYETPQASDD